MVRESFVKIRKQKFRIKFFIAHILIPISLFLTLGQGDFEFLRLIECWVIASGRLERTQLVDFEVLQECLEEHCLFDQRELIAETNQSKQKKLVKGYR